MSDWVVVTTQAELDAALAQKRPYIELAGDNLCAIINDGNVTLRCLAGSPHVAAYGSSRPHVAAYDSSQPHVVAFDSSQPRVSAYDASQPHVEAHDSGRPHVVARGASRPRVKARGFSQPHVEAYDSSQPRVAARGFVQLSLCGRVRAVCGPRVAVLIDGDAEVEGGQQTRTELATAEEWCECYGAEVSDGVAILYKCVGDDYRSERGGLYAPGSIPRADDWDGGKAECGGGLHFCATPEEARDYYVSAGTRFMACPVRLADMRAPQKSDVYRNKIKASGCCAPIWEVNEDGERIEGKEVKDVN